MRTDIQYDFCACTFINDFVDNINSHLYRQFADDALAIRDKATTVQQDLYSLDSWAKLWQMKFNPQKCYHLSVGKSSLLTNANNLDHRLQSVTSNPYSGVELQNDLKFNTHICKI